MSGYSAWVKQHWREKPGGGRAIVRGHRRRVPGHRSTQPSVRQTRETQADLSEYALYDSYNFNEYYAFQGLTPERAEALMTGGANISSHTTHNDGPAPVEMVAIAKTYNGTLCGYVIPVASGRDDAGIVLDGFTINASKEQAQNIHKRFAQRKQTGATKGVPWHADQTPDEFAEVKPGMWRFWWD